MGIFNDPKRLAKILASVKVNYMERPLSPIQVAKELQEACKELGGDENATRKRFGIEKSMWSQFKRLLNISEEIENLVIWGKSDPESDSLGFSVASFMARFQKDEQHFLVSASKKAKKPLITDDMKEIYVFKRENPEKSIKDLTSFILEFSQQEKQLIQIFISGLDKTIFENLSNESKKQGISLQEFTKNILNKKLSEGSVTGVNPHETFIRITFSEEGRKTFENLFQKSKVSRTDFVNSIFREEGF